MTYFDVIQRYLHKLMSREERQLVEEKLKHDVDLRQELESQKIEEGFMEYVLEEDISSRLNIIKSKPIHTRQQFITPLNFVLVTLAIFLLSFILYKKILPSPKIINKQAIAQIAYENHLPHFYYMHQKGTDNQNDDFTNIIAAIISGTEEEKREALIPLRTITEVDSNYLETQFIMGCVYHEIGEFDKAIQLFEHLNTQVPESSLMYEEIEYFLLVSKIATDNDLQLSPSYNLALQKILKNKNHSLNHAAQEIDSMLRTIQH